MLGKRGRLSLVHEPLSASPNVSLESRVAREQLPHLNLNSQLQHTQVCVSRLNTTYKKMTTREASHAGSWYSSRPSTLSSELDEWLAQVPASIKGKELPIPGARIIIAP
jgi:hypothetical protein